MSEENDNKEDNLLTANKTFRKVSHLIQTKHSLCKIQSTSPSDKDNNISDYQTVKNDYGLSGTDTCYLDKLTNSDENFSPRRKRCTNKRKLNEIINSPMRTQNTKRKHKVIILRQNSRQLSNLNTSNNNSNTSSCDEIASPVLEKRRRFNSHSRNVQNIYNTGIALTLSTNKNTSNSPSKTIFYSPKNTCLRVRKKNAINMFKTAITHSITHRNFTYGNINYAAHNKDYYDYYMGNEHSKINHSNSSSQSSIPSSSNRNIRHIKTPKNVRQQYLRFVNKIQPTHQDAVNKKKKLSFMAEGKQNTCLIKCVCGISDKLNKQLFTNANDVFNFERNVQQEPTALLDEFNQRYIKEQTHNSNVIENDNSIDDGNNNKYIISLCIPKQIRINRKQNTKATSNVNRDTNTITFNTGIINSINKNYFDMIIFQYLLEGLSDTGADAYNLSLHLHSENNYNSIKNKSFIMNNLIFQDLPLYSTEIIPDVMRIKRLQHHLSTLKLEMNKIPKRSRRRSSVHNQCIAQIQKTLELVKNTSNNNNQIPRPAINSYPKAIFKYCTTYKHQQILSNGISPSLTSSIGKNNHSQTKPLKLEVDKLSVLKKNYFDRGDFKVSELIETAQKTKMHIKRKVDNIHFNVVDQEEEMKKKKNMTKESLIFRTQQIKMEMKKKLETIEEILFFLIKENNFKEFKEIIEKYRVGLESRDKYGNTFLIFAVQCSFIEIIKYLIHKGADINARNLDLNTPLHVALIFKNFEIVDLLIKNGANEQAINIHGLSPWQCLDDTKSKLKQYIHK